MDSQEPEIRIFLVDARPWTRVALARGVEATGRDFKVAAFADPPALARAEPKDGAAVILINATGMALADPWPTEAWMTARSHLPGLPVVLLSDSEDADGVLDAIDKGLRGYIPISLELPLALDALRFVAAGGTYVPAEMALRAPPGSPDRGRSPDAVDDQPNGDEQAEDSSPDAAIAKLLTPRELSVLKWLIRGKSNKQIARELGIREATVKVHVRHMIAKFGANNRTQVALLAADLAKLDGPDDGIGGA